MEEKKSKLYGFILCTKTDIVAYMFVQT